MKFLSLVRQELLGQVRNLRFLTLAGTAALLGLLAVQAGNLDVESRQHTFEELVAQRQIDQARNGGRLIGSALEPGLRAVRPPHSLSVFVRGVDTLLPAYWDFAPSHVEEGPSALARDTAGSGITLDMEFLVRVVLGLLALVIGHDSLVRDRATGTLRALLSQPVPSWMILASKVAAGAIAIMVSLTLLLAVAFAGTTVWIPSLASRELLLFFAGIFAAGFLYLMVLLCCGFALAATFRSDQVALSISVVLWLYIAVLTPMLIPIIGTTLAPSQQALVAQLQATYQKEFRTTQEVLGDMFSRLAPAGTDIQTVKTVNDFGSGQIEAFWQFRTRVLRGVLEALETDAGQRIRRQRETVQLLMLASPASQFSDSVAQLAGTGRLLQERWEWAVARQHQALNAAVFDDRPRLSILVPDGDGRFILGVNRRAPLTFSEVPRFQPPSPRLRERFKDALPSLAVVGVYTTVLLAWTFIAFVRRDV